jgi:hypothetical protein
VFSDEHEKRIFVYLDKHHVTTNSKTTSVLILYFLLVDLVTLVL